MQEGVTGQSPVQEISESPATNTTPPSSSSRVEEVSRLLEDAKEIERRSTASIRGACARPLIANFFEACSMSPKAPVSGNKKSKRKDTDVVVRKSQKAKRKGDLEARE